MDISKSYLDKYGITDENLIKKARAAESVDELIALAETEGVELSDEDLEKVAGGFEWKKSGCHCVA